MFKSLDFPIIQCEQQQAVNFFGYKSKYAAGESIVCSFVMPYAMFDTTIANDSAIYIYPFGSYTAQEYVSVKPLKPEHFWSSPADSSMYGKVEFDTSAIPTTAFTAPLQFVFVKSGRVVSKSAKPFYIDFYSTTKMSPTTTAMLFDEQKPLSQTLDMMKEHARLEHAHHYLDKLLMITVLKSYEKRVETFLHKLPAIRAHLSSAKVPQYAAKYHAMLKSLSSDDINSMSEAYPTTPGYNDAATMVGKYEREIFAQLEAKAGRMSRVRFPIADCERDLRSLIRADDRFYRGFYQTLLSTATAADFVAQVWQEFVEAKAVNERAEQLLRLRVAEIETEWKQLERVGAAWTRDVYTHLNMPLQHLSSVYESDEELAKQQQPHFVNYPFFYDYTYYNKNNKSIVGDYSVNDYSQYKLNAGGMDSALTYPLFFKSVAQKLAELKTAILAGGDKPELIQPFAHSLHKFHVYFDKLVNGGSGLYKPRECLYKLRELEAHLVQFLGGSRFFKPTYEAPVFGGAANSVLIKYKSMVEQAQQLIKSKIAEFTAIGGIYYPFKQSQSQQQKSWLTVEREMIREKAEAIVAEQYAQLYEQLKDLESHVQYSPLYSQFKDVLKLTSGGSGIYFNKAAASGFFFGGETAGWKKLPLDNKFFDFHQYMYYEMMVLVEDIKKVVLNKSSKYDLSGGMDLAQTLVNAKPFKYFQALASAVVGAAQPVLFFNLFKDNVKSLTYSEFYGQEYSNKSEDNELEDEELFGYGGPRAILAAHGIYKDNYKYGGSYETMFGGSPWAEIKRLEEENYKLSKFVLKKKSNSFVF